MTTLVTGASGQLGSLLARRLIERGESVRVLTRRPIEHPNLIGLSFETAFGDVTDRETLPEAVAGCDRLYHVAGLVSYAKKDRRRLDEVNVCGTKCLLETAKQAGIERVVLTSSTAAVGYGLDDGKPLDEETAWRNEWQRVPYMRSKRDGERAGLSLADNSFSVVAVCPTTIYGRGDVKMNTGAVFERIKKRKMKFAPPGGTSVVSVEDCVEGHLLAMERGTSGRRYILASRNHTYLDLFSRIADVLDVPPPKYQLPRHLFPIVNSVVRLGELLGLGQLSPDVVRIGFVHRFFDSTRARTELNWEPQQSTIEMLAEAAEFYREHGLIRTRTAEPATA